MNKKLIFQNVKGWYIVYFGFILMLRAIGPFLLLPTKVDTLLFWPAGIIGCLLLLSDVGLSIKEKKYKKYDLFLILFILSMIISSIMNVKYGYSENIKLLMWQIIFFFIVFQFGKDYGKTFFIKIFSIVLSIVWFINNVASLYMFLIQYGIKIPIQYKYYPVRLGWLGNRLFGVYTDPNFGAVISLIVLILGLYYLINVKLNWILRSMIIINMFIQFSFIALSGSRTTLVCLLVATFTFAFFSVYSMSNFKNNYLKKWLLATIVSLISVFGMYILNDVTAHAWAHVPQMIEAKKEKTSTTSVPNNDSNNKVDLTRPDTESGDISNLRFKLWESSIEILKSSPISGGSPGYYIQYAHDKLPNNFMGQDNLTAHSFIFLIMAATGGLGLVTFFIFFIFQCYKALRYCFMQRDLIKNENFYSVIIVLTIAVSALFITELVLVSTIGAFTFWAYLGTLQKTISTNNKNI
ncbi:O-antigen ligase family protein [Enterococcus durans]|uniref:O-antigen ligase family protein n=1 Tax=Enterococcus durans TaxID=53345 RepID=UPI001883E462|nr:O-antigen ligase family protein [Enterococcus durans]MBE9888309.1 O-antigen ligase family protein [Enterococcus durans]MDB1654210.1 O-antigen ligase family protein [Enterococcus durans]MDB1655609.1 O-antigen ligase family protein [Enterococcus durans]MDB1664899.1 O-antigen ligase family protein [Enterococcus durans]MDB1668522.1 O-antigen ligase family protein [Enterococcus durans]